MSEHVPNDTQPTTKCDREDSKRWSISDERKLMEDISNQRFNFFMAFFAAIIAGILQLEKTECLISRGKSQFILLFIGIVIQLMMWCGLDRAWHKLGACLRKLPSDHPFRTINHDVEGCSVRILYSWWIPLFCVSVLMAAIARSLCMWCSNSPCGT